MCTTCNYENYDAVINERNESKLEQQLGMGSLFIRCDLNGKNYKLVVKGEPNSAFTLYRCPTCGKKLY